MLSQPPGIPPAPNPKATVLIIEFNRQTGAMGHRMNLQCPVGMLVNQLEIIKHQLVTLQLEMMQEAMKKGPQRPLYMADGSEAPPAGS
jgi:hypothetical protein